ncbi:MAG: energy transducer TonB [Flavobacteriales bacterium]|nr:energy transducer TonB [Flavobacteriales bacterium]
MFTAALLLLFTMLCILLSGDGAWDNMTQPKRNELVFEGRHRGYGAFVLRRDYDRRFILAFAGAVGVMGLAVTVPKAMALMGLGVNATPVKTSFKEIIVILKEDIFDVPKADDVKPKAVEPPTPQPKPSPQPQPAGGLVVSTDDTLATTEPVLKTDTATFTPTVKGPTGPVGPKSNDTGGGKPGMELGTKGNPAAASDVDSLPEFIGGHLAMQQFIQGHVHFPDIEDGAAQKAFVEFVVDTDGSITRVKSKGRAPKEFGIAAETVVKGMPKWKPAVRKGERVACILVLPIDFRTK